MADPTADDVRAAFEDADVGRPDDGPYEVMNVEQNRSQYRVFLDNEGVSREDVEAVLDAAFGAESVFGVSVTDERDADGGDPLRVVSFRLR